MKLFKFALKNLPLLEESHDMFTMIESQVQKMALSTQSDVAKQEKLLKFKEVIEEQSKRDGVNVY